MTAERLRLLALACLALLASCEVDDRAMLRAVGSTVPGGGAGKTSASFPDCGEAGAAGQFGTVACWSFDRDTEGWQPDADVQAKFSPDDAAGNRHSGSLSLTSMDVADDAQIVSAGATRCLPVVGVLEYELLLGMLVPTQALNGGAEVELEFLNAPTCEGLILGHVQYNGSQIGKWQLVSGSGKVPADTRSVLVRLLVSKMHREPSFVAGFDQVRLTLD